MKDRRGGQGLTRGFALSEDAKDVQIRGLGALDLDLLNEWRVKRRTIAGVADVVLLSSLY